MSNKYRKSLVFRNAAAGKRAAASYRKQFDLGLDGLPRRRGKKATKAKGSNLRSEPRRDNA